MVDEQPSKNPAAEEPVIGSDKRLHHLNRAAFVIVLVTLALALGATMYYLQTANETDTIWATALMLVSSILIFVGTVSLVHVKIQPSLLTSAIGISEMLKNVLWIFYVVLLRRPQMLTHAPLLSGFALFLAILMVVAVFQLTAWIFRYASDGESSRNGHDLNRTVGKRELVVEQLLENRLHAACGLVVAFLHVAYFMSFAVAFNDLAHARKTLRRAVPRAQAAFDSSEIGATPTVSKSDELKEELKRVYWFSFSENSASLSCTKSIDMRRFPPKAPLWEVETSRDRRQQILNLAGECRDQYDRVWWNLRQLRELRERLQPVLNADPYSGYRFEVVAHATEPPPKSDFASNYELSLARAQQVKFLVESLILDEDDYQDAHGAAINAEWILVPAGSGDLRLIADGNGVSDAMHEQSVDAHLTAELKITRVPPSLATRHRKWLDDITSAGATNLLDYLYFMIYTITTTGNGDLVPAVGYVQFVAALAGIFEVFFIVVVFNVVLALRKNPTGPHLPQKTA